MTDEFNAILYPDILWMRRVPSSWPFIFGVQMLPERARGTERRLLRSRRMARQLFFVNLGGDINPQVEQKQIDELDKASLATPKWRPSASAIRSRPTTTRQIQSRRFANPAVLVLRQAPGYRQRTHRMRAPYGSRRGEYVLPSSCLGRGRSWHWADRRCVQPVRLGWLVDPRLRFAKVYATHPDDGGKSMLSATPYIEAMFTESRRS